MRSIRYTNVILTLLAVLLSLQLWTQWTTSSPVVATTTYAQGIPDSGAQRKQIVDQLKLLNTKVDKLNSMFATGKAVVTVRKTGKE